MVSNILHFTGIKDFHETLWLAHICLGVCVVLTLRLAFVSAKEKRFKDSTFWGLVGIGICSGLDIILYYFQITSDNSMFVRLGALCYITFLGVQIMNEYLQTYQKNKQNELIYRLAYEDLLTEMYNRNSFMDDLKLINADIGQNKGRIIAVFDVNCLKYINDTFGHAMGDAVLKEGAALIKEKFGDIAKCYRTGGDEFAIISNGTAVSSAEIERRHMEFEIYTVERNKRNDPDKPYPLYVAFGYAVMTGEEQSAKNTLEIADSRMYANKTEIKEALKYINAAYVQR